MILLKKLFKHIRIIINSTYYKHIYRLKFPNIKELKNLNYYENLDTGKLLIIIRGETFRKKKIKTTPQIKCIESFIKHIILVLKKEYPSLKLKVRLIVYPNKNNQLLVDLISQYALCELEEINKFKNNQVSSFLHCMKRGIESNCDGLLIVRSDLAFISDLCVKNFSINKVLFQWNLLHNKYTLEVPDLIHFIGSIPLKILYKAAFKKISDLIILNGEENEISHISTCNLDKYWAGTLHNFLRFCLNNLELKQIGYMNYIKDPNLNKANSEVRGDPYSKKGNPLYTY